uniref:F5/8 type C domain-containing protein n=1 Tax=Branchiostoma floridae TaxID=7739 RepID=C3Z1C2_BRAFL|eukprot:XP_002597651.1 hypothetical protein BRAFLDRAFT_77451 [Branchiostoma floridae]
MAEDINTTDDVPRVDTNEVGLSQVTSIQNNLDPYAFSNVLPNPMYETTSCRPSENDADRSVPVEDNTTVPGTRYFQNTYEELTNHGNYDKDGHTSIHTGCNEHDDGNHMPDTTEAADDTTQAIDIADDDVKQITEQSLYQNDMEASKSNIHPTSPQTIQNPNLAFSPKIDQTTTKDPACLTKASEQPNSEYTTNISRSCNLSNKLYAEKNTTKTTSNDDYGTNVIPPNDIEDEIQEPVEVTDDNEDPYMPYAVADVFPNPSYTSACNSTKHDADKVAPKNDNTDVSQDEHIPSPDPSSMRDGLRRNPTYVPNVLQQARCQRTYRRLSVAVIVTVLLVASSVLGAWLYFNKNARDVQKTALNSTYTNGYTAVDTTYTNGQPAVDTTYTHGRFSADTTFTHDQRVVDITFSMDVPVADTTYIPGQTATGTTYTHDHLVADTTYTHGQSALGTPSIHGQPAVDTTYTNGHPASDTSHISVVPAWLKRDSWVVYCKGKLLAVCDATKALDGDTETYWEFLTPNSKLSILYIIFDLTVPHTLSHIAINIFGHKKVDIAGFMLKKSQVGSPYKWEDVLPQTNVQRGTDKRQEFGGFQETARYWKIVVLPARLGRSAIRELNLYGWPSAPKKKWRDDWRCGRRYPADDGNPAECDPDGVTPCCSDGDWCGDSTYHCNCRGCVDYRKKRGIKKKQCTIMESLLPQFTGCPGFSTKDMRGRGPRGEGVDRPRGGVGGEGGGVIP